MVQVTAKQIKLEPSFTVFQEVNNWLNTVEDVRTVLGSFGDYYIHIPNIYNYAKIPPWE